jgi:hypothetical protein
MTAEKSEHKARVASPINSSFAAGQAGWIENSMATPSNAPDSLWVARLTPGRNRQVITIEGQPGGHESERYRDREPVTM